ncbi:MAG: Yip1 family protein [Candidatus Methanoperedens sp.]|nr:Yip1 family protein [Candidatus Methanoperedens sp.]
MEIIMSFIERIKGTITNPNNTMKIIAQEPMIEEAVMIVGIYAALISIAAYLQSYKITLVFEGVPNMPSSMQSIMTISSIVFALITPFLTWFIIAGVVYLLSMAIGGEGRFYPQVITITGYSMLPMILAGFVSIGVFLMMEPQTVNFSPANPGALNEIYISPIYLTFEFVGIILQAWCTLILFYGIRTAHNISSNASAIIASIPIAFSLMSMAFALREFRII